MLGELKISFCTGYFLGKIEILNSSRINRNFDLLERKSSTIFENSSKIVLYSPGRTCLTRSYRILTKSDEILGTGIQSEVVGHRKMLEYSRSDRNYN